MFPIYRHFASDKATLVSEGIKIESFMCISNDTVARSDIYWDAANNRLAIVVA
jgi:hypothetical protein